jgi:hypothetical protein
VRSALVISVLVLAATVSACGKDADSGSASDATALKITVVVGERADPTTYELECDPSGGNHPQPAQACKALDQAGADVFEPVANDQMCTELYGGPQTATVKGTYEGDKVDAVFNRTNGCEIARWERLGTTFFNVPLQ